MDSRGEGEEREIMREEKKELEGGKEKESKGAKRE